MFHRFDRFLARLALLAGACLATAAHADDGLSSLSAIDAPAPAVAASAGNGSEAPTLDPQRWLPLLGTSGMITYLDQTAVRRRGSEVGVVLIHNAPVGAIKTTSGETIRSSLKRLVLNCATSMYAVVEQTLYSKRYARGESLYTIRAPQLGKPQLAQSGTVAGELVSRLCR